MDADGAAAHALLDARIVSFSHEILGWTWTNRVGGMTETEGKTYQVVSPIDRNVALGSFHAADADGVDRAVQAARIGLDTWRRQPWQDGLAAFRRLADELERLRYDLAIAALLEVGKSRQEALAEAAATIACVRRCCDRMEATEGFTGTHGTPRPFGVFAVIAPFSEPLAAAMGMIAPALLAGNAVVFKPAWSAGMTGLMIADALLRAGVMPEAFSVICGGPETGQALAQHAGIDGIAFAGRRATGMDILRGAVSGDHPRITRIALGGKNAAYVTRSADIELAAEGVVRAAFGLQGQTRAAISKVYVHADVKDAFVARLSAFAAAIRVGDPTNAAVFMGPLIDDAALARFHAAIAEARESGTVLTGGEQLVGGRYDNGAYVSPAVIADLPATHRLNREDLCLPLLSVLPFTELADAIADGNDPPCGVTAGCYAQDEEDLALFLDQAEAHTLRCNQRDGRTGGGEWFDDTLGSTWDLSRFLRLQRRAGVSEIESRPVCGARA
jgi:1-pyrroline-5-carboxylate dehydrogenase